MQTVFLPKQAVKIKKGVAYSVHQGFLKHSEYVQACIFTIMYLLLSTAHKTKAVGINSNNLD